MREAQVRRVWQRVDGVLLLDKSSGMTSNSALQAARRLYSAAKAGHTGTLDPLATGLLPLCFGEATKFSADLLDADKTYEADVRFGVVTDTGDSEGQVLETRAADVSVAALEAVLVGFRGPIRQVPPMYSALKRDGQPLYKLARQGVEVEREARDVVIHALELLSCDVDRCRLRVRCSKGTYIRTLAEDIGRVLGCGAHLTALRRTAVGELSVVDALNLDALTALDEVARSRHLRAPDALLQSLPAITLVGTDVQRFSHGNPVSVGGATSLAAGTRCRVYADGRLLGLGGVDAAGLLCPRRLVAAP